MRRRLMLTLTAALIFLTAACGGASAPTATDRPSGALTFDGLVKVAPGRSLAVSCYGQGEPAVVYLHGLIQPGDSRSWAHSPELLQRVASKTTYCEYERTNVGRSSTVAGPIPIGETVADLTGVIAGAGIDPPVVLVGGSFGGLVAYSYAGMHPEAVAGVVLLDPTLPDEPALERTFLGPDMWLPAEAWRDSEEKIDVVGAYTFAQTALTTTPPVPGTIFVTQELWVPEGDNAEPFRQAVRAQQAALAAHFRPGKTITVDAPHTMLEVVPDQVAAETLTLVEAARS